VTSSVHDVVVIGGGVTGAGIARDLARRGASVLLLEKGDYGGGTSGASSWMIHGGPRYLEFDWRTTRLSAEDAGKIVTIARHMVHRVVFLIPVMPGDKHNIERLETAMEVYDRFQPLKLSNRHLRLTTEEALELEPGLTDRMVGAMTMEEWGCLRGCRYLLHDRDAKFCQSFRELITTGSVNPLRLPARSPNLNAYAERWVRSVKEECLSRLILFGESSLRRA